jgi:heme-degrading monooxygenase HmoA
MIARAWTGVVRTADAETYGRYIEDTGFSEYGRTAGNAGALLLRRDDGETTTFVALSVWEDEAAVRAFAGDDIEAAVAYPEDARYLVAASTVEHFEVVSRIG